MKGKKWVPEWEQYKDRLTGVTITQLTNYAGHSHHLYFTENGWYDNETKLLFCSDRENKTNVFSINLLSGEIIQLTDYQQTYDSLSVCIHPSEETAYIRKNHQLIELNLETYEERLLFEGPEKSVIGNINCTADGKYLITCLQEDYSDRFEINLGNGYIGHQELMEAKPKSQILQISLGKSQEVQVVHEEENFITHINTSPTQHHLITFCHEGPWHLVDHRIWGLDLSTGRTWKIRERKEKHEKVGHEYWYQDGIHIGYHGFREDGTAFFGKIRYDNESMEEVEFHFPNWHAHSHGFSKIAIDGRAPLDKIIIWGRNEGELVGPKVLCEHRCSFHSQKVHAHPRFNADGTKLLFTSDKNGYGNLFLVDIPRDLSTLPDFNERLFPEK